jgi:chromate transporter
MKLLRCAIFWGPNIVNLSVVFGGFAAYPEVLTFLGLVGPPVVIVTVLAAIYARYGEIPALQRTRPVCHAPPSACFSR